MKIRRFYSKNMRNALKQVTDEFGNDAAILSSQKTPSGVEVIAALDYDEALLPESISSLAKSKEEVKLKRQEQNTESARFETSALSQDISDHNEATVSHLEDKIKQKQPDQTEQINYQQSAINQEDASLNHRNAHSLSNKLEWSTDPGLIGMKEELGLMRSMMKEQLDGIGWQRLAENDPITAMLNRRLTSLGVSQSVVNRLVPKTLLPARNTQAFDHTLQSQNLQYQQTRPAGKTTKEPELVDPECKWQKTLAQLTKSIPIDATNIIANGGILALIGPSGVGKTTTIAKLAARYVIKHGPQSVALITTDSYRAAGRLQLQSFAKLLKVPVAQITESYSLENLIQKFTNKKLILIDTPSLNFNDSKSNTGLQCLQSYCQHNPSRHLKKLLLLSATHQQAVLQRTVDQYRVYSPDSCIITKLDEAVSLGEIISLLIENNLPVSYTSDGQNIPENIRVARNHHLVSKAVWLLNKQTKRTEKVIQRANNEENQPMQAVS